MATTFGHNFNFAAAKHNGEAFQQFPSHGLFHCLPLSLCPSLRPRARSENFHFLKLSPNVFYTFPQTPSENAAFPTAFLCECTRRVAGGQSRTKCHHFRWECYVGRAGDGGGVPLAKLAQASTTTRMTSRSSRRLSATATATSNARKGLTKKETPWKSFFFLHLPYKTFDAKASQMKEVAEIPQNIYIHI